MSPFFQTGGLRAAIFLAIGAEAPIGQWSRSIEDIAMTIPLDLQLDELIVVQLNKTECELVLRLAQQAPPQLLPRVVGTAPKFKQPQ